MEEGWRRVIKEIQRWKKRQERFEVKEGFNYHCVFEDEDGYLKLSNVGGF